METENVYLVGVHHYSFRPGLAAKVVGVKNVKPKGNYDHRLAYEVVYDDGTPDYVCFIDVQAGNYEFVTQLRYDLNLLPDVKY